MAPKTSAQKREETVQALVSELRRKWSKPPSPYHLLGGGPEEKSIWTALLEETLLKVKQYMLSFPLTKAVTGAISAAREWEYDPVASRSAYRKWRLVSKVTDGDKEWVPKEGGEMPSRDFTFSDNDVPVAVAEDGSTTIRWNKKTSLPYNRVFKVAVDSDPVTYVTIPYGRAGDTVKQHDCRLNTAREWVKDRWLADLADVDKSKSAEIIQEALTSLTKGLQGTQQYLQGKADLGPIKDTQATCLLRAGCGRINLPNGSQQVVLPVWQLALEPELSFPEWSFVASSTGYPQRLLTSGVPESKDTEMGEGP